MYISAVARAQSNKEPGVGFKLLVGDDEKLHMEYID